MCISILTTGMNNFCLAQGPSRGMIPNRETKQGTYSWKVEQQQENKEEEEEEEDNLHLLLRPTVFPRPSVIPAQSCRAAGLFCPRWPVLNPAAEHQGTPWITHTGTRKWDLLKVSQDEYTPFSMHQKEPKQRHTGPRDVGEGCESVFPQPGHCTDSKPRWITGVIQRLFAHKRKPRGNQSCLQVGASDCLEQQLKCRVSFMNHLSC